MRKVVREEKKYLINMIDYYNGYSYLNQVLIPDSHNGVNGYLVRSLYFDTLNDKDFDEKIMGVEIRRKIRLRIYNPDDNFAFLEIKQKQGQYQRKRSLKLEKEDALKLICCDYECLLNYDNDFARECYVLLKENNYRPKTVVEYRRKAFIAKENNIRITFDSEIKANENNFNIFDKNLILYPVFPLSNIVLEVKFNGFLLSYIKSLLDSFEKSELSVSKYCLARQVSLVYNY